MGVTVATDGGEVIVQRLSGPDQSSAGPIALPARLTAMSSESDQPTKIKISGRSDLVRRLETEIDQADLTSQDEMLAIANTGSVRLWLQDKNGLSASVPRKVHDTRLPMTFWIIALTGLFGAVIGLWLLTMRAAELAAQAAGLAGVALLAAALPMAVIDAAELIIGGQRYALLLNLNYVGGQVFGAAFLCLFASYPIQLFSSRITVIACCILGLAVLPIVLLVPTVVDRSQFTSALVGLDLALIVVALVMQWVRSNYQPVGRAYLRLVGTVTTLSLGGWIACFQIPPAAGMPALADFSYGFLLMLPPFAAIALGIAKGHLFDIDRWAWKLLASAVVLLGLLVADLVLVFGIGLAPGQAASASLLLVGTIWLVARNRFLDALLGRRRRSQLQLSSDAVHVALAPTAPQRFDRWKSVLSELFEPLEIVAGPQNVVQASTLDSGRSLLVPAPAFGHALLLRGARLGRSLFQGEDCETVTSLLLVCDQVDVGRDAYDRGTREERERIAKDLHDDVSARLLTSLHRTDAELVRTDVRAAMSDIRSIVAGLEGHQSRLDEVLATLRHDCCERLEAAEIKCTWTFDPLAIQLADPAPYLFYKALNSAVREAVTNVIRHAQADRVEVLINSYSLGTDRWLRVTIADNGVGISPNAHLGHGSRNMKTRIRALGGHVESTSGQGTTISMSMPLEVPPGSGDGTASQPRYTVLSDKPDGRLWIMRNLFWWWKISKRPVTGS